MNRGFLWVGGGTKIIFFIINLVVEVLPLGVESQKSVFDKLYPDLSDYSVNLKYWSKVFFWRKTRQNIEFSREKILQDVNFFGETFSYWYVML